MWWLAAPFFSCRLSLLGICCYKFIMDWRERERDLQLQGDALLHKTYAARLMGGEAAAPALVTSLLRFMVDLAKMCHPFSVACRRSELLECLVELYFACAR
jgi:hypothetical protein